MAVETILPANSERALDYTRVNPKDQPLKFLHPDGSVTDSQNVNVTASALSEGAATEAKQDATIAKIQEVVDNTQSIEVSVGDVDVNTDALEAKADALLDELKLKADLTETQPISILDGQTAKRVGIDALGQLKVVESVNLVGTSFTGTNKDINFWTETVTGSGAVVQDGEIFLNTGTTINSTAKYSSVRKARKIPGTVNQFRTVCRFITASGADNIRRIGAYDALDGFFFELNGTTLNIVTRRTSGGITTDTPVASGSFNGNWGTTFVMDTVIKRMVIDMAEFSVQFYINDILLHSVTASTLPLSSTYNLPVSFENINSNGNTTAHQLEVRFAAIQRLGSITTAVTSRYLGTNATHVLKYGAGILQKIVITDNAGTIVVYDNITNAGTILATIDAAKTVGSLDFGAPYNIGLTVVIGTNAKCTVIYE